MEMYKIVPVLYHTVCCKMSYPTVCNVLL